MQKLWIGIGMLVIGAGLGAGTLWLAGRARPAAKPPEAPTQEHDPPAASEPARLSRTPEGDTIVRLETATQERVGLKVELVVAATRQPEVAAYGLLQEDPACSFTLRAPVAGVVSAGEGGNWPDLDQHLDAGVLVGYVEPRLSPTERLDLATRLAQARADAAAAEAAVAAARSSYESKKQLNAQDKAVSDRVVEEARVRMESEEARLNAAQATVHLVEAAQSASGQRVTRYELRTEQAGQVVETLARPGEAVEAGQVLLRIVRFDTLLARVEVPLGQPLDETASTARIVLVGHEDHSLPGQRIGLGVGTSYAARGLTLLFRVPTAGQWVRPGAAVLAHVPAPGGERTGVMIPRSAVVRLLGKPWVYVQAENENFVRRELSGAEPIDDSWFATSGFHPGDRVVTDGAQVLLSEELKAQIEREETAAP